MTCRARCAQRSPSDEDERCGCALGRKVAAHLPGRGRLGNRDGLDRHRRDQSSCRASTRPNEPLSSLYGVDDPEFAGAASVLFGPPLVPGNEVTPLYNGRQIFGAMLEEIRRAQKSITFETYIYWSGDVGAAFTRALVERAHAGVKIHLIIDAVGSGKMDASQLQAMREAGAEIEKYRPVRWYNLDRINNRTHRKLLVVDGKIGFTGGVGIADKWDGDADSTDHWRDTHFRVVGPVVAQMQATFVEHWLATQGRPLARRRLFPRALQGRRRCPRRWSGAPTTTGPRASD